MKTFTERVNQFLDWLGPYDGEVAPMVGALEHMAEELDTVGVNAAMLGVFGTTYRSILKTLNKSTEGISEGEDFLNGL